MSKRVPEGWRSLRLKYFAKARRGTTYIASELSEDSFSYPLYINMKSFRVGGGYSVNGDKFYTSPYAQNQLVKANDLLIANTDVTASCDILGAPVYLLEKKLKKGVLFSHHVTALSLSKGINKLFLFYLFCLDKNRIRMQSYGRGTTVKMLDSKEFSNLLLIIPPIPEQKKIASILTSVDEVIENTQKQIDKLQDLKKATMNELLTKGIGHTEFKDSELGKIPAGWKFQTLGEISSIVMGQSPDSKTYNDEGNGLPFFQGKADFGVRTPKVKYWCSAPSKVAPKNSILFSVRAPVGGINFSTEKCCIGRGLASITAISVEQEFLYQSLLYSKPKFEALGQGSTFEAVNGAELKGFTIKVPPLAEQKKILSILSSIDKNIEEKQQKLLQTQSLKKSLMQDLLTGKVRVKVN